MNNLYIIKSSANNYYFIDIERRIIQFVHPSIVDSACNNVQSHEKDSLYYLEKSNYFKKFGIFQSRNVDYKLITIDGRFVENCLINTSQIVFEVTDQCNLKCKYCAYGDLYNNYNPRNGTNANLDNAKSLIDYYFYKCIDHGFCNKKISIGFYGGEPLLNFDFIKSIISYIENFPNMCNDITYNITTNGVFLDRYLDYLVEKKMELLISLDGDEYASSYRVNANNKTVFDKVIRNVDLIRSKFPLYYESNVNFNAVLHNRNSFDSVNEYFQYNFNKIPSISPLNPSGINTENRSMYDEMYNADLSILDEEICLFGDNIKLTPQIFSYAKFVNKYRNSVYYDYLDLLSEDLSNTLIPTGTCLPFGKKIYVTVNGEILPCERVGQGIVLGRIKENIVEFDFDKIADMYNVLYQKYMTNICSSCQLIKNCSSCIFHMSEGKCNSFMNLDNMELYLKEKIDFLEANRDSFYYLNRVNIKY